MDRLESLIRYAVILLACLAAIAALARGEAHVAEPGIRSARAAEPSPFPARDEIHLRGEAGGLRDMPWSDVCVA